MNLLIGNQLKNYPFDVFFAQAESFGNVRKFYRLIRLENLEKLFFFHSDQEFLLNLEVLFALWLEIHLEINFIELLNIKALISIEQSDELLDVCFVFKRH